MSSGMAPHHSRRAAKQICCALNAHRGPWAVQLMGAMHSLRDSPVSAGSAQWYTSHSRPSGPSVMTQAPGPTTYARTASALIARYAGTAAMRQRNTICSEQDVIEADTAERNRVSTHVLALVFQQLSHRVHSKSTGLRDVHAPRPALGLPHDVMRRRVIGGAHGHRLRRDAWTAATAAVT